MNDMKNLDAVLTQFAELAKIPRPSHHEEQVSSYLFNWALEHGLYVERDEMGEIIIDKPASEGCESVPRTIMQAHMDMVCVAAEGDKPKEMGENAVFVPLSPFSEESGMWIVFQDADTGEYIKTSIE